MVFIVSASVLSHTLYPKEHKNFYVKRQLISKPTLERYKKFIYCVPGLSCHPRAKNPQKNCTTRFKQTTSNRKQCNYLARRH